MRRHAVIVSLLLCVCGTAARAQAPSELSSAPNLVEDAGKQDSWTYRDESVDFAIYKRFRVEPTVVYAGPEGQWGRTSEAQKQEYAALLTKGLTEGVAKAYPVTTDAAPGTATLRLTLLGVEKAGGPFKAATSASPLGLITNTVKSATGKEGTLSGSVLLSLDMLDAASGKLLFSAVRRRSPEMFDFKAAMATDDAVRAVAEGVAESIVKGLDKAGRTH